MLSASWRKDKKDASQTDWSQKLDHVQRQQQLLERTAELSKDAESEKGGLVIIEARYGCHSRYFFCCPSALPQVLQAGGFLCTLLDAESIAAFANHSCSALQTA